MKTCRDCRKEGTPECAIFEARNDLSRRDRLILGAVARYINKLDLPCFEKKYKPTECIPRDVETRHCYAHAIQAGQRDLFET